MPNTITDTITELADNKSDIQDALVAKGVTSAEKHGFNKFAEDIASITNQYTSSDEGKVVSGGQLVAQTATTATTNGTIDTTTNNEVIVDVSNSYTAADEGKVVDNGQLVAQTAYGNRTTNGTVDTTTNNSIVVNVPTYSSADNGKVIKNGALTAQTAYGTVTSNGTYNTTYNKSIVVNVSSNSAAIPLTTADNRVNNFNAFVVKNNSSLYIYGTIKVITDIRDSLVCTYDSNIDISALDRKGCYFKAYPSGDSLLPVVVSINTSNKTLTFAGQGMYSLTAGSYAILSTWI